MKIDEKHADEQPKQASLIPGVLVLTSNTKAPVRALLWMRLIPIFASHSGCAIRNSRGGPDGIRTRDLRRDRAAF